MATDATATTTTTTANDNNNNNINNTNSYTQVDNTGDYSTSQYDDNNNNNTRFMRMDDNNNNNNNNNNNTDNYYNSNNYNNYNNNNNPHRFFKKNRNYNNPNTSSSSRYSRYNNSYSYRPKNYSNNNNNNYYAPKYENYNNSYRHQHRRRQDDGVADDDYYYNNNADYYNSNKKDKTTRDDDYYTSYDQSQQQQQQQQQEEEQQNIEAKFNNEQEQEEQKETSTLKANLPFQTEITNNKSSIRPPPLRPPRITRDDQNNNAITTATSSSWNEESDTLHPQNRSFAYGNYHNDNADETATNNNNNNGDNDREFRNDNYYYNSRNNSYNSSSYQYSHKEALMDTNLSQRAVSMAEQIIQGTYDCMICQHKIGRSGRIWTCSKCCAIFHLSCIDRWARANEAKQAESEHRIPRDDYSITGMKCPGCNHNNPDYHVGDARCYCKKNHDMGSQGYNNIPHSCGEVCEKPRGVGCPHPCMAICHPGPCKPCPLPAKNVTHCECGKMEYRLKCGQVEHQKKVCNEICGKPLSCGRHTCTMNCHHGACPECAITTNGVCYCGKVTKALKCGEGVEVKSADENVQVSFSCDQTCNKLLECGKHHCRFKCHSGSCSGCPRVITHPTRCACGKTSMPKAPIRKSCLDPLPTCNNRCDRMLSCGKHFCAQQCHDSPCPPCSTPIKKPCRCGSEIKSVKCSEYEKKRQEAINNNRDLAEVDDWIRCRRKCNRILTCGIHKCKDTCCLGKEQPLALFPGHQCREVCNKPLPCGRHKCASSCHSGHCQSCGVTLRDGLSCACGEQRIPGPILCGTVTLPPCKNLCLKYLDCGHRCNEYCHFGPCGPCTANVSIPCKTHGVLVHNIPCWTKNVSCGNTCEELLPCQFHTCQRTCHSDNCVKDAAAAQAMMNNGCTNKCGMTLICGHKCNQKCHPNRSCDPSVCQEHVRITCICGAREDVQHCGGRKLEDIRAIACGDVCKIAERNKRLREVLNIKPSSERIEEKEKNESRRIPYPSNLLERCCRQMQEDAATAPEAAWVPASASSSSSSKNRVLYPHFVLRMEKIFSDFLSDENEDLKVFASLHPDCTILGPNNIYLPKLSREERAIVFAMLPHYNLRGETDSKRDGKTANYANVFVTKIKDRFMMPTMLLSAAIMEYQKDRANVETLESCPPERMIVIDNGADVTSATLTDRLQAWSGDYIMWRSESKQIFFVFTNEELRNSALTVISKFGGRKANELDSGTAYASKKAKATQKKARQKKKKEQQIEQQKAKQALSAKKRGSAQDGWKTVMNTNSISDNSILAQNNPLSGVSLKNNRFG